MPPCYDVYVWIRAADRASALATFIDRYVDPDPGEPRFDALVRVVIDERPDHGDSDTLASLSRDSDSSSAFSLYLRARTHQEAIVTLTEEGDLVLGLGIDDPLDDPTIAIQAAELISSLRSEFHAVAGMAGVELRPPQSAAEWRDEELATLREGNLEPPPAELNPTG